MIALPGSFASGALVALTVLPLPPTGIDSYPENRPNWQTYTICCECTVNKLEPIENP